MNLLDKFAVNLLTLALILVATFAWRALDSLKDWLDERAKLDNIRRLDILTSMRLPQEVRETLSSDGWEVEP